MDIKTPTALLLMLLHYLVKHEYRQKKKLQGSVATYLICGGVVNNQIKKGLFLSPQVKIYLVIGEYFGKVTSKNVMVSCTLSAWPTHC